VGSNPAIICKDDVAEWSNAIVPVMGCHFERHSLYIDQHIKNAEVSSGITSAQTAVQIRLLFAGIV